MPAFAAADCIEEVIVEKVEEEGSGLAGLREENRGSLVCGHVGVCVLQRVCVSVCAWRRPPAAPCTCG